MVKINKWVPKECLPDVVYIEAIIDDYSGFRIIVKGKEELSDSFEIHFPKNYGYRNFNESYRLKTYRENPDIMGDWSLFKMSGSNFENWLFEESLNSIKLNDIKHFIISSPNEFFEVLAPCDPIVKKISTPPRVNI